MERLELAPQERIKLLARVRIPPVQDDDDDEKEDDHKKEHADRDRVVFVIEALQGATAEPIRREVPFYVPEED